jgi:maltooligosyltrehalose trehalohydrolase
MGEEYGEQRPFQFFTDHTDPAIAEATRNGRAKELERFTAFAGQNVPDPQDESTFERSKLAPEAGDPALQALYTRLLALRRQFPREVAVEADEANRTLRLQRGDAQLLLNFSDRAHEGVAPLSVELRERAW